MRHRARASAAVPPAVRPFIERGEIGGRTVQIIDTGEVECVDYPTRDLHDGEVRIRTVRSAVSPGTEMTFYGRAATNVNLHRQWDAELRLFVDGPPTHGYPVIFGYRAAGEVTETRHERLPVGARVYGNWHHTEWTILPAERAAQQMLPDELSWDDGVDVAHMGPICANAVAFAEKVHKGSPAVVFGAGPIGLISAQVVRATGAAPVYVVDRLPARLEIAARLGLEPLDASAGEDIAVTLKRRHGSEGIPVAWECTGSTPALHQAIRVVRRLGRVVAVGFYQGEGTGLRLGDEFHHNGVTVVSGQIGNVHPAWTIDRLRAHTIELARSGAVRLGELPRMTVPVERIAEGFAALSRPEDVLQLAITYGPGQLPPRR